MIEMKNKNLKTNNLYLTYLIEISTTDGVKIKKIKETI